MDHAGNRTELANKNETLEKKGSIILEFDWRVDSDIKPGIYNIGISLKPSPKNMLGFDNNINNNDATSSLLPRTKSGRRYFSKNADAKTTLEVEATSIDEFMKKNEIEHIDILKFDIQGGELMALKGAQNALDSNRISIIYTEALFVPHYENNPLLHDIWSYLARFDYSFFDIYDLYRATNGQLRFADVIFVNRATRNDVIDRFKDEP